MDDYLRPCRECDLPLPGGVGRCWRCGTSTPTERACDDAGRGGRSERTPRLGALLAGAVVVGAVALGVGGYLRGRGWQEVAAERSQHVASLEAKLHRSEADARALQRRLDVLAAEKALVEDEREFARRQHDDLGAGVGECRE